MIVHAVPLALKPHCVDDVVTSIGLENFGSQLFKFLHQLAGVEYCSVFQFSQKIPKAIVAESLDGSGLAMRQAKTYVREGFWRSDPVLNEMQNCFDVSHPTIIHLDVDELPPGELRSRVFRALDVRERLFIYSGSADNAIAISVLRSRSREAFDHKDITRITKHASTLLAIAARHQIAIMSDIGSALRCLDTIMLHVAAADLGLPSREIDVCARILYGMFGAGIAVDLGISEQTVITYRKRLYERLGIATQRELLLWYIDIWHRLQSRFSQVVN